MLGLLFPQLALAATTLGGPKPSFQPAPPLSTASVPGHTTVVAGPYDQTALDILNNTRPDILAHGATRHCPAVTTVYVNGHRRLAPDIDHGFSNATLYLAGDTVMVMLTSSVADALRTVLAESVRDITYVDCKADGPVNSRKNVLSVTTTK